MPAIKETKDGEDFILGESHAILRYLADTRGAADNWYPKDLKKRAKVDEYLDSHHTDLRGVVAGYVSKKRFSSAKHPQSVFDEILKKQKVVFAKLEKQLESSDYLCGSSEISIADLSGAMELEQLVLVPEISLTEFPKLNAWKSRVLDLPGCTKQLEFLRGMAAK